MKIKVMDALKEMYLRMEYGEVTYLKNPSSFREFKSMDEVKEWGVGRYSGWAKAHKEIYRITEQYTEGSILHVSDPVNLYLGEEYSDINKYLRQGEPADTDFYIKLRTSTMIVAISSAPVIGQKIVLYRQVPTEMIEEMINRNRDKDHLPYQEKGFMSTSMLKTSCAEDCGNRNYMLKMYVEDFCPIHAIYANAIRSRSEAELLLPPGLYIRMAGYPYTDEDTGKTIYEVQLFSMSSHVKNE